MEDIMKKKMAAFLAVSMLLCGQALAADFSNLVIIHTNDTHGFDRRAEGINGMATVSALRKHYLSQGKDVLLVDAGDAIQDNNLVNFSKGKSAIAFMNAAGYDAMALGNHEFDYGQEVLAERIREAKFPMLSANVIVEATGRPLTRDSVIYKKGDVKIGIIGLTTPETVVTTNPKNVYGLKFLNDKATIAVTQNLVKKLKEEDKCDLIVAVGHLGSEDANRGHRSDDILMNVNGIDIFIDGHDHTAKNKYINGALLAETGHYTKNIGVITHMDNKWTENFCKYGDFNEEDPVVKELVDKTQREVDDAMALKLGETPLLLNGSRDPGVRTDETNLGDFVADAYLWQAQQAMAASGVSVDGCLFNGGSLRQSIEKGNITVGNISGVLPYNNQLYVMKIKGETLLEIIEAATCSLPSQIGAFPQVSRIRYTVNTKVPYENGKQYENSTYFAPAKPGSRVTIHEVGGKPFDADKVYTLVTTEFICRGGDAYGKLTEPGAVDIQAIGYVDTEAVENYLKEELKGTVPAKYEKEQGRVTVIK